MPIMIATEATLKQAAEYLSKQDPSLAEVIKNHGPCDIAPHRDYYRQLVGSIITQQLSVKVADVIFKRFRDLFPGSDFPSPEAILKRDIEDFRQIGMSYAKARYVRDLAQHVVDGKVKFDHLDALSNEEIIKELTAVKGIGEWTVHMFLMFCMGRLDVLAHGDLGIKNGAMKLYGLKDQPDAKALQQLAKKRKWHPYETVACWYIWASLDNKPA